MSRTNTFLAHLDRERERFATRIPSVNKANAWSDAMYHWLFPVTDCDSDLPAALRLQLLRRDLELLLWPVSEEMKASPAEVAKLFFEEIPHIYDLLMEDANAFYQYDPAATGLPEVMAAYPGFRTIAVYRIAHALHLMEVPLLPRLLSEHAHSQTGIDIHPAATIGRSFFIDHGTGVVIGATTVIGDHVRIYQGVTLGALQVDKSLADTKRHPTIEDNTVIYANSTILGGNTVVGHDSVIGGNTWLTQSVPAWSLVYHQAGVKVRARGYEEPINFVI